MDETPRKLHPRTVALLQQSRRSAPPRSPERPLQLIPVDPPTQPAKAQPPKAQPPKAQPPKAALRVTLTGAPVGVTPLLPGLGLGSPTRSPRAPQRSVRDGVFAALSAPDAPLTDVVIFDTETTGRDDDARLVEIGALRVRDGKVVEQFQTLVDPEIRIPRDAMEVHGITDAMVRGAPRARPVLRAFVDFVGDRPLMAHNASFDRRIVGQELARVGLRPPGIPLFCSLRLSRRIFPQAPGHSLKKLRDYLQIPDPPAHRAIADCMTTLGLLLACAGRHPLRTLHVVHGAVTAL
jgi:DNA polymerase-3 subunit epsilon